MLSRDLYQHLDTLNMSQSTFARLARIAPDRLSRFLSGNLELRPNEMDRLERVVGACVRAESGQSAIGLTLPVDWDRVSFNEESDILAGDTDVEWKHFEGDIEFEVAPGKALLSVVVPMDTLRDLIAGDPRGFLQIKQGTVAILLGQILRNPETSDVNKAGAQSLLELLFSNPYATDLDRYFIDDAVKAAKV
jgi:hypothetical protein